MVSDLRTALPTLTPPRTKTVLYTAAHSGFDLTQVPLGGAATVCARLAEAWRQGRPFEMRVLSPSLLGMQAPKHKDLVRYSELRYARFCFEFEKAITEEILKHDPKETVVLSNDISEGPNFRLLAERGYRIFTIYHVDVVDYFSKMYLHGWMKPETTAAFFAFWERTPLRRIIPQVLKLVFTKERDSLVYSRAVIVPSESMKQVIRRCYPEVPSEKIQVIPWGSWEEPWEDAVIEQEAKALRQKYQIPSGAPVLLTLSRISPEKGQDQLLRALELWETRPDFPCSGVWLLLCGEAAYMQGVRFQKKLEKLSQGLKKTRVIFPGHIAGLQKQAHFRLADLYVFPSRHESYGLTLLEALRAGLPALACHHYGAEDLLQPEFGELLPPSEERDVPQLLQSALQRLLSDKQRLKEMGQRASMFARQHSFSDGASRLADLLKEG